MLAWSDFLLLALAQEQMTAHRLPPRQARLLFYLLLPSRLSAALLVLVDPKALRVRSLRVLFPHCVLR